MRVKRLRFTPPTSGIPSEVDYVLTRAFGPIVPFQPQNGQLVLNVANRLDLSARMATRIPRRMLETEVGVEATELMFQVRRKVAERAMRVVMGARLIAQFLQKIRCPVVFLKGAALHLLKSVAISSRDCGDIDFMVPGTRVKDATNILEMNGWQRICEPNPPHHPVMLKSKEFPVADIHDRLPGLYAPGANNWLTFEEAKKLDLIKPLAEMPEGTFILTSDVMAAHAVVHSIAHHGFRPASQPSPFRMVADLMDLKDPDEEPASGLKRVTSLIYPTLDPVEIEAVIALVRALARGELGYWLRDEPSAVLLRHFLAGVFDDRYAAKLDIDGVLHPFFERTPIAITWYRIRSAFFRRRQANGLIGAVKEVSKRTLRSVFARFMVRRSEA